MKLPILAACVVAGSTWSIASADQTTPVNPKTAAKAFKAQDAASAANQAKPIQDEALLLQRKLAAIRAGTLQGTPSASGSGAAAPSTSGGTIAVIGGDDCSAAEVIVGTGTFLYDCTTATTGAPVMPCGLGGTDMWFSWVAPSTGVATMTTCGGSGLDTVLAAWTGAGCPGGPAIACNDDTCGLQSNIVFPVTAGSNYMLTVGGFNGINVGPGSFTLNVSTGPSNDDCATPTAIAGYATFPFDNVAASTGTDGQTEGLCLFFGTPGITNDLWYEWTAPATGTSRVSTCGGTGMDSKIAVYGLTGCPAPGTAMACNDDACGLQTRVTFPTVAGSVYLIQLGNYPGATGAVGTFTIDTPPPPPPPPPPCSLDDGLSENSVGLTAGGDLVWVNTYGSLATPWSITQIDAAWGSLTWPSAGVPNGTPSDVFIYSDPTQDGDPSDAVLLRTISTAVANVDSDSTISIAVNPPENVVGLFFVGCHVNHPAGGFPIPIDMSSAGVTWAFGGGPVADYAVPSNNLVPPTNLATAIGVPGPAILRVACSGSGGPATYFCDPGSAGVMACPCSNPPSGPGRGCDNSDLTGGASISMSGSASLAGDTLVCTTLNQVASSFSIVLQGDSTAPAGAIQGQGVRCVDGNLLRLYVKLSSGGSVTAPQLGDLSISAMSASFGDLIPAGSTRYYSVYYRDPTVLGGCPALSTYNTTSAAAVVWN